MPSYYNVNLKGSLSLFACKIPEEAICDFTDYEDRTVHLYGWIDKDRGMGTQVRYTKQSAGLFSFSIPVKDGDVDLLKLQACSRVRDQDTGNIRTITLAVSAIQLEKLLEGNTITTTMNDPFTPENAVVVTISAENASSFANYKGPTSKAASNQSSRLSDGPSESPLIKFKRSALWNIAQMNTEVDKISEYIQTNMKINCTKNPPGGEQFASGISRYKQNTLI